MTYKSQTGFTLLEVVAVTTIIAIIATIGYFTIPGAIEEARFGAASANMAKLAAATKDYADDAGKYPADGGSSNKVNVDGEDVYIPPVLVSYLGEANLRDFKEAPWKPHSWYDFNAWDVADAAGNYGTDGVRETIQINVQFCDMGPITDPATQCSFPPRFQNIGWENRSQLYYCVKGYCRSHYGDEYDYPGYCINCPNHEAIKTKDGR